MSESLKKIFEKVSKTKAYHQKYLVKLRAIYETMNYNEFLKSFWFYLQYVFQTDLHQKTVQHENVIEFSVNFCLKIARPSYNTNNLQEQLPKFFLEIINKTLSMYNCKLPQVRYFMCFFWKLLLKNIGEDVHLDDNLCIKIENVLLESLEDKFHYVRAMAVGALFKLQNPSISKCPIINAYIKLLHDTVFSVRKEVVLNVAPCKKSLTYIAMKVRDVNKYVKLAAYEKCATINPKYFGITERQSILLSGFEEEDDTVKKKFTAVLLPNWISKYNNDFLKFMHALNLGENVDNQKNMDYLVKNLMSVIFKKYSINEILSILPLDDDKVIKYEILSSNAVNFWNLVINYLIQIEDKENLDKVLPDVSQICKIIERFLDFDFAKSETLQPTEKEHILKYLCQTITYCDLNEEGGRQNVNKVLLKMLNNHKLNQHIVDHIMWILNNTHDTMESLITNVLNVISNLETNVNAKTTNTAVFKEDRKYEISKLQCKHARLESEQETAIQEENYNLAKKLQDEMEAVRNEINNFERNEKVVSKELKNDSMLKCLLILNALLKMDNLKKIPNEINDFKEKYISTLLNEKEDKLLYVTLLRFIILCAINEKENVTLYLKKITEPLLNYDSCLDLDKDLLLLSINGVNDLLLLYGPEIFQTPESTSQNGRLLYTENSNSAKLLPDFNLIDSNYIIDIFADLLDHDDEDLAKCCGMALLKLIVNNITISSNLLSRIILKWFNPASEIEDTLHQYIGVVLIEYVEQVTYSDIFETCIMQMFKTIAMAPKHSPLADIDVTRLIEFLSVMLLKISNRNPSAGSSLICRILRELLMNPTSEESIYLCKMLLRVDIPKNRNDATEINTYVDNILSTIRDIPIKPYIENYRTKLQLNCTLNTEQTDSQLHDRNATNNQPLNHTTLNENNDNQSKEAHVLQIEQVDSPKSSNEKTDNIAKDMDLALNQESLFSDTYTTNTNLSIDAHLNLSTNRETRTAISESNSIDASASTKTRPNGKNARKLRKRQKLNTSDSDPKQNRSSESLFSDTNSNNASIINDSQQNESTTTGLSNDKNYRSLRKKKKPYSIINVTRQRKTVSESPSDTSSILLNESETNGRAVFELEGGTLIRSPRRKKQKIQGSKSRSNKLTSDSDSISVNRRSNVSSSESAGKIKTRRSLRKRQLTSQSSSVSSSMADLTNDSIDSQNGRVRRSKRKKSRKS